MEGGDLTANIVTSLPESITYIPNFITREEEEQLLQRVYEAPQTKWTHLSNRRLQNWGGLPHAKGMLQEEIPAWLQQYFDKITKIGAFGDNVKPNHCLVNEYKSGQGIMPHEDGSLFYPTVSTITLGSHAVLDFYRHIDDTISSHSAVDQNERHIGGVLLEKCSLVLVQEQMYTSYLHGIREVTCDHITNSVANIGMASFSTGETIQRDTRVSLTIRNVPKVISSDKLNSIFGKRRR